MIWHYYDSHYLLLNSYKMIRECWFLLFLTPLFEDSPKTIKHRHPNKSVGMGKITKINKHRAYVYSGVNSKCRDLLRGSLAQKYDLKKDHKILEKLPCPHSENIETQIEKKDTLSSLICQVFWGIDWKIFNISKN